jgi:hypothetical protein
MAYPHNEEMVWVGGRWWWFHGSSIDAESIFEWRDNRVYLLEPDGSVAEGILFVGGAPLVVTRKFAYNARHLWKPLNLIGYDAPMGAKRRLFSFMDS